VKLNQRNTAGILLFAGGVQFTIFMVIAEVFYSGYNVSGNAISDLGVGPTSSIFNPSIILLGIMIILSSYYLLLAFNNRLISAFLALCGLGAVGVGLFPETTGAIHYAAASISLIF